MWKPDDSVWGCKVKLGFAAEPRLLEADMRFYKKLAGEERGATAIEYGLIAALIAIAAIGAMAAVGGKVSNTFSNVSNNLTLT